MTDPQLLELISVITAAAVCVLFAMGYQAGRAS